MKQYKHLMGYVAIALVCVMLGSALTLTLNPAAQAENTAAPTTVVVESPFTAAIAKVVKEKAPNLSVDLTDLYVNKAFYNYLTGADHQ